MEDRNGYGASGKSLGLLLMKRTLDQEKRKKELIETEITIQQMKGTEWNPGSLRRLDLWGKG